MRRRRPGDHATSSGRRVWACRFVGAHLFPLFAGGDIDWTSDESVARAPLDSRPPRFHVLGVAGNVRGHFTIAENGVPADPRGYVGTFRFGWSPLHRALAWKVDGDSRGLCARRQLRHLARGRWRSEPRVASPRAHDHPDLHQGRFAGRRSRPRRRPRVLPSGGVPRARAHRRRARHRNTLSRATLLVVRHLGRWGCHRRARGDRPRSRRTSGAPDRPPTRGRATHRRALHPGAHAHASPRAPRRGDPLGRMLGDRDGADALPSVVAQQVSTSAGARPRGHPAIPTSGVSGAHGCSRWRRVTVSTMRARLLVVILGAGCGHTSEPTAAARGPAPRGTARRPSVASPVDAGPGATPVSMVWAADASTPPPTARLRLQEPGAANRSQWWCGANSSWR
jgi:hypothetical protein